MEKDNVLEMIKSLAKLKGYDVIKSKEQDLTNNVSEELGYETMPIGDLKEILNNIQNKYDKLNLRNTRLKEELCKFLNDMPANDYTQAVYSSNNFMDNKLVVRNKKLSGYKRIIEYINGIIVDRSGEELINKFEKSTEEFKDTIKSLKIEHTTRGYELAVEIKEEDETIEDIVPKEAVEDLPEHDDLPEEMIPKEDKTVTKKKPFKLKKKFTGINVVNED